MLLVENRELLMRFRRGDASALEEVYVHYSAGVAGLLRSGFGFKSSGKSCRFFGTRTQWDLEDRLHDVFARAFSEKARLNYDGLTPYRAYLNAIARNLIIDEFRSKERALAEFSFEENGADSAAEPRELADPIQGTIQVGGNPQTDTESAEVLAMVEEFKKTLGPRERQVYELRFIQELLHSEIQEATGLSHSKIKTSEQRIRERFFNFMRSHGYFSGYVQESRGWLRFYRKSRNG